MVGLVSVSKKLFSSYQLGRVELKNRVVMAPMTRSRSPENVPGDVVAEYYEQRAEAGLIITEGTSPSPHGVGYARIPGLYSPAQVAGWKKVTERVHAAGSRIFAQLMHTGRVSHPANLPAGATVFGPSAVAAPGQMFTDSEGMQPFPTPVVLTDAQVEQTIEEFVKASKNAIDAGFDGVELHGANGYLIEQFLNVASNQRTDAWGGSVENRTRFALEVTRRAAAAIGADRVGIRLSPYGVFNGSTSDPETDAVYLRLAEQLSALGIVYLHTVDHTSMGAPKPSYELYAKMRKAFRGTTIVSGGYDLTRAEQALESGTGDLVAFGRPFIANPKLVSKLAAGATLAAPDMNTLYTPGTQGYTDYPA
jgi:N-ethylmaleimide reductase